MARKSDIEVAIEGSIKYPVLGVATSIFFAGTGLYLKYKGMQPAANPAGTFSNAIFLHLSNFVFWISGFFLFFSIVGFVWQYFRKKKQTSFYESKETLNDLKHLSWKEFEEYTGELFKKLGYAVEVIGGLNDGGIDLRVKKGGKTYLVQCKKYLVNKVSLSMVRDFYGAISANLSTGKGYFITTGIFTLEAIRFAEDKPIELIDGAKLMEYVRMADTTVPSTTKSPMHPAQAVPSTPICPQCGSNMVLRTAKKGSNIGTQFWGCATYPKCKGTLNKN